jgi:hypothetical protein
MPCSGLGFSQYIKETPGYGWDEMGLLFDKPQKIRTRIWI